MHIAVILFAVFAAWRWGDWKNWHRYHSTMLFVSGGVLLYLYLYKNTLLWDLQFHLMNHIFTELLYAFIVLPSTVLLFLSNFSDSPGKRAFRILKFIAVCSSVEFIYYKFGFITYNNGWNFWLSMGWYCMMFPMLAFHFKKPIYAYFASLIGIIIFLNLFPIKM